MALAPSEIVVEVSDTQTHLRVDKSALGELVRGVLEREGRSRASISIALVDDATIRRLNLAHLGHDWPTDVITFPLSGLEEAILVGEVVVSVETACAAAQDHSANPTEELALYVVHGLLHLCGYDDRGDADRAAMRARERQVLAAAGILTRPE
jgi:probable rRNA maturation factor